MASRKFFTCLLSLGCCRKSKSNLVPSECFWSPITWTNSSVSAATDDHTNEARRNIKYQQFKLHYTLPGSATLRHSIKKWKGNQHLIRFKQAAVFSGALISIIGITSIIYANIQNTLSCFVAPCPHVIYNNNNQRPLQSVKGTTCQNYIMLEWQLK